MKSKTLLMVMGILLALTVMIVPFMSGCTPQQQPPATTTPTTPAVPAPASIKIGAMNNLTGPLSPLGKVGNWGYVTAVNDINKAGGVYVKEFDAKIPLELVTIDMEASVEKTLKGFERLNSENAVVVVGETYISAVIGEAEKNKLPVLAVMCALWGQHQQGFKYWFGPYSKTNDTAKAYFDVLDSIPDAQRPTKIGLLEEQMEIGIEFCNFFKEEAVNRGYEIVAHEKYARFAKDLSPAILVMKDKGVEVVTGICMEPDGMTLMKQSQELDFNPKAFCIVQAADTGIWPLALGPLADYVLAAPDWHHSLPFAGVADLNAKYQAEFNEPAECYAGPSYASIQIVADAIERAGTLDREKVRDAIAATNMMTVRGQIQFREDGTLIDPVPAITQWQKGVSQLIWPADFKTQSLIYPTPGWKQR
jgi:branched-chain amino acid transport system substrate-binding protein